MANSIVLNGLEEEGLATEVADFWQTWDDARTKWKDRYAEVLSYVYATSTNDTGNACLPWSHTTHIPKLTQINDNLGVNYATALMGGSQWFGFDPAKPDEASSKKRNNIAAYIQTKHDLSGFKSEMIRSLQDWVQSGNAFGEVEFIREEAQDPISSAMQVVYYGPRYNRISPLDIVFDITARSFYEAPKIVRKMIGMGDLDRYVEERGPLLGWKEDVVAKAKQMRVAIGQAPDEDVRKSIQRRYDGFADAFAYFTSQNVELLEFYGDIFDRQTGTTLRNHKITVLDRRWVLSSSEVKTLTGKPYLFQCGWRDRPDNLMGQGPLDNLIGMQYLIDHLENARADAFDKMLTPDRVHIGNVEITRSGPVTNYWIDDGQGSVQNLAPDATVLQADFQIQVKEAQMEAYAGAPREAMGIRSPGEKTAFEVETLRNAATQIFQVKIEKFEKEYLEPVLQAELESAWLNMSVADVAKTLDSETGTEDFITITPDDLRSSGKLKARGASHYARRSQLVRELTNFQQVLQGDPEMKAHFPAKARARLYEELLGFDRFGLMQPFGSIAEQVEAARTQQAAQQMLAEDDAVGEAIPPGV